MLAVDHHALAGERLEVDAMTATLEAQLDSVMQKALAPHPLADARAIEDIDALMLQDPCPHAAFDV